MPKLNKITILYIAGGVIIVVIAIFFMIPNKNNNLPSNIPTSTSQISNQQAIDASLAPQPSGTTPLTSGTPAPVTPSGCDLSFSFQIVSGSVTTPGNMGYKLISKNIGNTTCESASLSVYYASNETFISSIPKATADGYYWQFGNLTPGEEQDVTLTTDRTAPLSSGDSPNEGCLSANNGSDACSNASTASPAATPAIQVATANSLSAQTGKELGIWVWTPVDQMSTSEMQQTVNEVADNGFNTIYLTVDDYLSITRGDTVAIQNYDNEVSTFISMAEQKGIAVDAESGSSDWALPNNQSNAQEIMDFVSAYNASQKEKFRGIQYDIEPYLLPQYNSDEQAILTDYVQLTDILESEAKTDGLPLTMVLPHFFDDVIQWTPEVTVDGVTNYPYEQILRILNESTGNRVIIMAYRNFAAGADGSIDLSQTEVSEADKTNVKVIVAQETGPVTPSYVTFYGMSLSDLATQVSVINKNFDSDNSFGGIAIDYLNPFLLLL